MPPPPEAIAREYNVLQLMTPERLQQIEELYHAARQREAGERAKFLASACAEDEELRREVALLLAQDSLEGPMEEPALKAAAGLLQISPGEELGPYRILSRLGEGGMATVYEARDTRLGRTVALKVVHADFSRRFQREARAISSLNHPHVCVLHDVGTNYLVMERLEGQTLAAVLANGALPMSLVLQYGAEIADAVAAAHARGIAHRDLKPGNIMVTETGVKVLDFGLAKFVEGHDPGGQRDDSVTERQTILGSPAYMAPEQLEGKPCDARTDIFALGLILFEMAAGKRAFQGQSRASLTAEIMKAEPDYSKLSPPAFAHTVERCLAKNPDRRWQTARDVQLELEFQARSLSESRETGRSRRVLWAVAATVLAGALFGIFYPRPAVPDPSVMPFTSYPGHEAGANFSPDGSRIAFTWNGPHEDNFDVYVKQIGPGDYQRLTSDPQADTHPKWSPDGTWIAFLRHRGPGTANIIAIPAMGGPERPVGESDFDGPALGTLDWSPDGQSLLTTKRPAAGRGTALAVLSFDTGEIRPITSPPGDAIDNLGAFAPDGHALAFLRTRAGQSRLMVVGLSRSLEPIGTPIEISSPNRITSLSWTADSRDLVVAAGGVPANSMLWRIPASGKSPPRLLSFAGNAAFPAVSRKGNRMAFARGDAAAHIWALDLDSNGQPIGPPQKAYASTRTDKAAKFSSDGRRVAFNSDRAGAYAIWVCETSREGCSQLSPPELAALNPEWSPDGKWIAFNSFGESGHEIDLLRSEGGKPKFLTRGTREFSGAIIPHWSRDGRWIYFHCGERQICRVASSGGEAQPVRSLEGEIADESPDGRWLYFSGGFLDGGPSPLKRIPFAGGPASEVVPQVAGRNWVVTRTGVWYVTPPVNGSSDIRYLDFAAGATRTVFHTERPVDLGLDISPDQRRVLFTQLQARVVGSDIMLVENFR